MNRFSDLPSLALVRGLGLAFLLALMMAACVPVVAAAGDQPGTGDQAAADPVITVWHGATQEFGTRGNPQLWINILGNARGVNRLQYSLNDGPYIDIARAGGSGAMAPALEDLWHPGGIKQDLLPEGDRGSVGQGALGPGALDVVASDRLESPGDFNVEIRTADLLDGENIVRIRANKDDEFVEPVTVRYAAGNSWQIPYSIDWDLVTDIADVAQVVDGQWQIEGDGIRPTVTGYDRVVAIGDLYWQDFDLLVPITLHEFSEPDIGGVGVVARWLGHFQVEDEQPGKGWWNMGAYGLYRNRFDDGDKRDHSKLWMYTGHYDIVKDDSGFRMDPGIPYYYRMRVQTKKAGDSGFYSFKVWEVGEPEPAGWTFAVQDSKPEGWQPEEPKESPRSGSVLLVAHEVDATFGDVVIQPLVDLAVSMAGSGSVQTSPELVGESDAYLYGDTVRLEALADPGWVFVGWSGDQISTQNPFMLTLMADTELVATFGLPRSLDIAVVGQGRVVRDPEQEEYGEGAVVMLEAKPDPGNAFVGWSGDLLSTQNPVTLTMMADTEIVATFSLAHSLDVEVVGNGSVARDPEQDEYADGSVVVLRPRPDPGWTFNGWGGANGDELSKLGDDTWSLAVDGDKAVTALFGPARIFLPIVNRAR